MRIYLSTSNKYTSYLCPINVEYLNKYWPGQDITIVGYEDVLSLTGLPSNVDVHTLGRQSDFGKAWTTGMIPFFQKIPEKTFAFILDDQVLAKKINKEQIATLKLEVESERAEKAMIGGGIIYQNGTRIDNNLMLINQDAAYRTSLHPAIWSKRYFLRYLRPNFTSWDFELKNNPINDGARIVNYDYKYPEEPHPYTYVELYTKGKLNITQDGNIITNQPSERFFDKKDIKYMWNQINKGTK
jgi:hypothetical protein